jgi:hypothetical protein
VIGAVGGEALAIEAAEARVVLSLERLREAHMSLAAMLG